MWHIFYTPVYSPEPFNLNITHINCFRLIFSSETTCNSWPSCVLPCDPWHAYCYIEQASIINYVQILFCSSFIHFLSYFHPNSIFSRCFQLFYLGWQYFIQPGGINTRLLLYSLQGPWDQSRHNFKPSNPQQFAHSPPRTGAPLRHGVILIPRHTLHIR